MNPASPSPLPRSAPGAEASAAFALLCACTRVDLSPERASPIANWDFSVIDWPPFLHLAEHHGVLSLAARNLLPHASRLPAPIVQELRAQFDANLRRNLWFASELVRITEQFEQNGLRAI